MQGQGKALLSWKGLTADIKLSEKIAKIRHKLGIFERRAEIPDREFITQ